MRDFISFEDMAKTFIKADEAGHISDINNYDACDSECDSCPAKIVCLTLSQDRTESHSGRETYYDSVLPIIKEIQNDQK